MVNIDKIYDLAKEKGIKLSHICEKLGVARTYFADIRNKGLDIPESRLSVVADILSTTPAYLKDETDEKNKPAEILDERVVKLNELMKKLSPDDIDQVLDYVRFLTEKYKDKK